MSETTTTSDVTPPVSEPTPPESVRIACAIATGEARDPAANAIPVRAAYRNLNSKGNGAEWYRMVYRNGQFTYFSDGRMPTGKFLASERRVTLLGDVYAGEIVVEHDRGGPVNDVMLVCDPFTDSDGDARKFVSLKWSKQRNGIRAILPTGASITVPNPRSK